MTGLDGPIGGGGSCRPSSSSCGAEPGAVWQDLKFTPGYVKDMERFALVGDKRWHKVVTELSDKLGVADAEFFELSQLDQAWDWIRDDP